MKLTHCIGDGYTREHCYIAEDPGIHPALDDFDYRPMLAMVRQSFQFRINKASEKRDDAGAKELGRIAFEILTTQITRLNLIDERGQEQKVIVDGKVTEIGKRLIVQMEPNLMIRLQHVCMGNSRTDDRPAPAERNGLTPARLPQIDLTSLDDEPLPETDSGREALAEAKSAGN